MRQGKSLTLWALKWGKAQGSFMTEDRQREGWYGNPSERSVRGMAVKCGEGGKEGRREGGWLGISKGLRTGRAG